MTFTFDAAPFGGLTDSGTWSASDRTFIQALRGQHPELATWGDLALGSAWGAYSTDIYAVSWVDWLRERDDGFLAYLYVSQVRPDFQWGGTGLFMEECWAYGEVRPWETNAPLPSWACA